ncbi:helix-turn-helix transcriptional regulator [Rhodococcus spelaei]|uniref:Helix-turn-helix transcriptional regulator n=1 Tax=Rhodococcus spelaei TaxID=2546320 RepID=A0A541B7H1_9NOCA|nr:helix-turn-helix domain-containing protein [Rhodococcus spelaei]TQF68265.1 helix-turn-helix transcriptional regulator [Rhodococcus spelaei]
MAQRGSRNPGRSNRSGNIGLSQLDLAHRAGVSPRHVSFLETGRSRPTKAMLLRLSEQLDIPLRERNSLLLAGGFAPAYPEHSLSAVPMAAVAAAVGQILEAQLPNPTVVVDRHWTMVAGNAAVALFTDGCAARLLEPPVNVLRLSLHPDGMATRIVNLGQWRAHLLHRLDSQIAATGDPVLRELAAELAEYPGGDDDTVPGRHEGAGLMPGALVVPIRFATAAGELAFLSTTTVFGTPLDVTVAELAIETFYPANPETAAALRAYAGR